MLATPGLDRHAAYVALSRHRDQVELHYGEDDFADLNRLGRVLSRERAKDMALDHDGASAFAERRGISFRARVVEVVEKVRDIFAGFKPRAPAPTPEPEEADLTAQRAQLMSESANLRSLIAQITQARADFVQNYTEALNSAQDKEETDEETELKAKSKLDHEFLTAPADGTVQELSVTSVGQVVTPGQQLMVVAPDHAQLEVEAIINNEDAGFVRPGQTALIKVDTYPYTQYGLLRGTVRTVSRDAVDGSLASAARDDAEKHLEAAAETAAGVEKTQDLVYTASVTPDRVFLGGRGERHYLRPGMTLSIDIKTGTRTILQYILSPLLDIGMSAGHER